LKEYYTQKKSKTLFKALLNALSRRVWKRINLSRRIDKQMRIAKESTSINSANV
jgi:hypothetical protein